jgi:mono/diheme cytochrome c family protein
MQWLQGQLSAEEVQAIADALNSTRVTGQQRYVTDCAGCHGIDARGGRVGEAVRGASSGSILEAIQEEQAMGYLGCLPSSDVKAIGTYLKGLRGGSEGGESEDGSSRRRNRD